MHDEYKDICSRRGHFAKVYTQMPPRFSKALGNPDGIILFTRTVSHEMIRVAVKEAKRKRIPLIRGHNSSGNSLEGLIHELERVKGRAR